MLTPMSCMTLSLLRRLLLLVIVKMIITIPLYNEAETMSIP